jgi:hypothetical protein
MGMIITTNDCRFMVEESHLKQRVNGYFQKKWPFQKGAATQSFKS